MIRKTGHQPAQMRVGYCNPEMHGVGTPFNAHTTNGANVRRIPKNGYADAIDSTGMTKFKGVDPANASTTNYFGCCRGEKP